MHWTDTDARRVATAMCELAGLRGYEPELLRFGSNAVFGIGEAHVLRVMRPTANEADVHREIDLVQEFARLDIPTAQLAEVPAQQPLKALAGLRPIPARHAPWLACPWALSVNSTWPTFLSPPQVGLVQFTDSGTGTHANYRPGVDPTLTVDSRLTAVPPKPSKLPGHYMAKTRRARPPRSLSVVGAAAAYLSSAYR